MLISFLERIYSMKIRNLSKSDPHYICYSAQIPKTLVKKAFGLTICNNFKNFDGFFMENCKIIHSFFMRFSFDAVFLDADFQVIAIYSDFKPFRISKYIKKSKYVLELPKGSVKNFEINLHDKLEVITKQNG